MTTATLIKGKEQSEQSEQPKAPKPKQPPSNPIFTLIGQRVTVQQRGGVVVSGKFASYKAGLVMLEDVTITGASHRVSVPWCWIDRAVLAHIHPEPQEVETV